MKRLFIILLSSFFFSASLYSNPGLSKELSTEYIDGCAGCKESVNHTSGNEYDAIVNRPIHRTTGSTAQSKLIRCTCFIDACALTPADPDTKEHFLLPYPYCSPLHLQLIFPQHYFW